MWSRNPASVHCRTRRSTQAPSRNRTTLLVPQWCRWGTCVAGAQLYACEVLAAGEGGPDAALAWLDGFYGTAEHQDEAVLRLRDGRATTPWEAFITDAKLRQVRATTHTHTHTRRWAQRGRLPMMCASPCVSDGPIILTELDLSRVALCGTHRCGCGFWSRICQCCCEQQIVSMHSVRGQGVARQSVS